MDITAARTLLEDGKKLRSEVVRSGSVKIIKQDDTFFIAKLEPTTHTETETWLERLTAAAGIFCAAQNTSIPVGNSLADAHGLGGLAQTNLSLYYLYNVGLDHELEHAAFHPMVLALMTWREKYVKEIYGRSLGNPQQSLRLATISAAKRRKEILWRETYALCEPYNDILKSYPYQPRARADGKRAGNRLYVPAGRLDIRSLKMARWELEFWPSCPQDSPFPLERT